MSTPMFDAASFLQATFDESNSTVKVPIPAELYECLAEKVDIIQWSSGDGSKQGLKCVILWEVMSDEVREITGRAKNVLRHDIMLDLTEDGRLDFGKGMNVQLGRLREALDLNEKGRPFSFPMIQGRVAKIQVKHEMYQNEPQAKVGGVIHA